MKTFVNDMPAPSRSWCSIECYREDCLGAGHSSYIFCRRRLNALEGKQTKREREEATMKRNFRIVMAVFMGLCLTSITVANAGKIGKAVNSVINPDHEGVVKVEATDAQLASLEKEMGVDLASVLPRNQKMDYEIVKIKVARSRFAQGANRNQRLFFFSLTSVPIEEVIANPQHPRPFTCAITQNNSVIRYPRGLRAEDVKVVTVFTGKLLRVIELI